VFIEVLDVSLDIGTAVGFNVKVKSSIDVNNMLDSNKKIREKICSLEEIDDDETDVEIDINKSDISSDYFSALSSQVRCLSRYKNSSVY
jgi:hypothetical protein